MTPAGSQQLRAQDLVPARQWGTEGKTIHQERGEETVTVTGTGAGTRTRTGTGVSTRAGMGARKRAATETILKRWAEGRERSGTYKVVIEAGWKTRTGTTPISNQQPKPRNPTPNQTGIMRRIRAQGRSAGDGIGEGGEASTKRQRHQNNP